MVIGVQFNKAIFSNNSIIELYKSIISKNYPKIEERPYLNLIFEEYNKPTTTKRVNGFHTRKLFISEDDCKIIQIQSDKMLFNWRKRDNSLYPRFHNIYEEFKTCLNTINKSIQCLEFINQYEITYIDHFQLETFNLNRYNLSKIFKYFELDFDSSNIEINFAIPKEEINGNLNVIFQSAIRNNDIFSDSLLLQRQQEDYIESKTEDVEKEVKENDDEKYYLSLITEIENKKDLIQQEYNFIPPNQYVSNFSKNFILKLLKKHIKPYRITPSADEGMCFVFKRNKQVLYFEIYNNKEMGYIIEEEEIIKRLVDF